VQYPVVTLAVPDWVSDLMGDPDRSYPAQEERMALAIRLARANVDHGGGPFGAILFQRATRKILAPGVNLVVQSNCSVAHAEIVALMVGQQIVGSFDLGAGGAPGYELVASSEPCAQCFGALPWSGIRELVCGSRADRAEAIGFDEGPKPATWVEELERRGILVSRDVLADEANDVLKYYAQTGRIIY
jgi:tRNA(Arg) A34 adenosine deaminase TadA